MILKNYFSSWNLIFFKYFLYMSNLPQYWVYFIATWAHLIFWWHFPPWVMWNKELCLKHDMHCRLNRSRFLITNLLAGRNLTDLIVSDAFSFTGCLIIRCPMPDSRSSRFFALGISIELQNAATTLIHWHKNLIIIWRVEKELRCETEVISKTKGCSSKFLPKLNSIYVKYVPLR